jgi:hypothetical protein
MAVDGKERELAEKLVRLIRTDHRVQAAIVGVAMASPNILTEL